MKKTINVALIVVLLAFFSGFSSDIKLNLKDQKIVDDILGIEKPKVNEESEGYAIKIVKQNGEVVYHEIIR